MIIDVMKLRNFRLFKDVELHLGNRVCVVVGINGAGKSTLLDAMSILLSCYIGGFDGLGVRRITQSDIRHVTHKSGSFYENVSQLPVEISATGTVDGLPVSWKCQKLKDSPQSPSPSAYEEMTRLAKGHQLRLREGDGSLVLPLMAYYGTSRLWKREASKKRREDQLQTTFRRLSAYEDCLDAHLTDTTLATWYERIPSSQLSVGYRVALSLFADIAYRAAQLNPQLGGFGAGRDRGNRPHRRDRPAPAPAMAAARAR